MTDYEQELVSRLRDPSDDGRIGEHGMTVRCAAAALIEHYLPLINERLAFIDRERENEREACAKFVHDRLGADGHGVAQMIRAGKHH